MSLDEAVGYKKNREAMDVAVGNYPKYAAAYDPNDPNYRQGYDAFKGEALRKGPSSWLNLTRGHQGALESDARERGAREVRGQTAMSMDDLAAGGGLSSGARERVSEQGQKNYINMSQDLSRQGTLNDLSAGVQDEQNRIGELGNLTNMEEKRNQDWTDELQRKNAHDLQVYQTQMQAYAAQAQADATASSGKSK